MLQSTEIQTQTQAEARTGSCAQRAAWPNRRVDDATEEVRAEHDDEDQRELADADRTTLDEPRSAPR